MNIYMLTLLSTFLHSFTKKIAFLILCVNLTIERLNFDSFIEGYLIRYGACVNTIRGSRADVANDSPNMS